MSKARLMKDSFISLFVLFFFFKAGAQQLPLFTQYREYLSAINPGAVTNDFLLYDYTTSFGASYRRQFSGVENGISTQMARAEYMSISKKILVSGYLLRDQTGPSGTTGAYARMAYLISYDPRDWGLGIGLSGGVARYRINTNDINWTDSGDPVAADDLLKVYPDIGAGVFYYKSLAGGWEGDRFFAGISVPQMFGIDLNARDPQDNKYRLTRVAHFYYNMGLIKYVNENTFIEPSVWLKYVPNTPLNLSFSFRSQFGQMLLLGLGYSTAKNLHLEAGIQIGELLGLSNKLLRVGYSYDNYFSRIGPTLGPAHEINLIYALDEVRRRG